MKYFLDTEFDGFGGPLISLALVREDGQSLYCITEHEPRDAWVRENVCPIVLAAGVPGWICPPGNTMGGMIADFMSGDADPVIVTDWPSDIRYFCEAVEYPGGNMAPIASLKFELHRVDAYPTALPGAVQHNAWWDAMALREKLRAPPTAS